MPAMKLSVDPMRNIRLDLCYDGTRYKGWQRLSGVENKFIKIVVNENQKKPMNYNGTTIEGQGVLFITDKKIDIPLPPKFVKQTHKLTKTYNFRKETVLMDAHWTAHPEYLRGEAKTVHVKHDFVLAKKPAEAAMQTP